MKLNAGKTEYVFFTRNPNHRVAIIKLEDKLSKCVEETKLLGVILDKRMTFQSHLKAVERKAPIALGSLMIVGKTEKIVLSKYTKLYNSIVVPHLEYAFRACHICKSSHGKR